ncbi:MAG: ATP-binding protein [Acidobacteriota bacterium]
MKNLMTRTKLVAVLAIGAVFVVIGVLNLRDRLSAPAIADDGVEWVNGDNGLQARSISPDSPLRFTLKKGDYVKAVFFVGRSDDASRGKAGQRSLDYEEIKNAEQLSRYLDQQGVGNSAQYAVLHHDYVLKNIYGLDKPLYDVPFKVIARDQHIGRGLYLAFIGLVYLAIGLFVLLKQHRAILTYHFFAWSLVSFTVYLYSSTRELTRFDGLVSVLDGAAWALMAPLFLHFCINFVSNNGVRLRSRRFAAALYLPAVTLVVFEALFHYRPGVFNPGSLVAVRDWLDKAELIQFWLFYFVIGNAVLLRAFYRDDKPLLKQQLRWIIRALGLSGVLFTALYFIPYLADVEITPLMETVAYTPFILIPLSFGYSIVRYRLMDVDVIMRRSFVHAMATVAVGAIYMAVLLGVGDLVKFIWKTADLNSWKTRAVVVVGMLVVAMLFAPIKNKMQVWADRWFYGERYTLRTGLQDFGRTLAQTTALPRLLDSLVRRLSDMLSVRKVGIFIEETSAASGYRLSRSAGIDGEIALPQDIKQIIRARSIGRGFITADDLPAQGGGETMQPLEIDATDFQGRRGDEVCYYVPCVVRDRMVAIIAVGRTTSGALLTSEDTDLLRALSGYVAVAIDNSLLYRSEMEKAEELVRLKEFSESIIESVNVGILSVGFDGMISTWNSALEEIFGIRRERALGCAVDAVLDRDLIETIQNATGEEGWALQDTRHIYKYNASTEDGRPLTINMSLAPFEGARGVVTGTLVVIENVTERAQLEEQLLQREKLSSIGLLAAGVAHEVNTPLAGISSYAQMLLQQIDRSDPKRRLLEKIHTQTVRASGIVNNLLNFSRTGDTLFREIELNSVLDDTLQLLEPQLRNARLDVVRNYGRELPAAYGNASKLQQVFMNLILNARDAMPNGGRLSIHTRLVETSLVVDFRDTGIGMAPETIARIYDPFFTTKEVGQGTGLGLALSYGIVQEHGGRIFVESRPGEGAHFTIKLPTAVSRQMQAASD